MRRRILALVIEVMNWIGGGATNQLLASGVQKPYSLRMTAEWGEGGWTNAITTK